MRSALLSLAVVGLSAVPLAAEPHHTLGWGRLFSNDYLGDGQDRWRSGAYTVSMVRGTEWTGARPGRLGEIVEYRFRTEIFAPIDLGDPDPADRRYAGALSFGVHSHAAYGNTEVSFGGDLVFTGPQTGLGSFQKRVHEWLADPIPDLDNQIEDGIYPQVTLEVGRALALGGDATVRPFAEAIAGAESLVRIGADLHFGRFGQQDLQLRDLTTGQLYRGTTQSQPGTSFTLGGDVTWVGESVYLPSEDGYDLTDQRTRLRAGVHWQGRKAGVFYGLTYLGEEFEAQSEGQVVGSLRVSFDF